MMFDISLILAALPPHRPLHGMRTLPIRFYIYVTTVIMRTYTTCDDDDDDADNDVM